MPVKYSVAERPNPRDPNAPKKFYGTTRSTGEVTLRNLSDELAIISTVSQGDTAAVLETLLQVIPRHLLEGRIVRLGDLGTFRLTMETVGAETEEEFTHSNIKRLRLNFRPGKLITKALKTADYEKV